MAFSPLTIILLFGMMAVSLVFAYIILRIFGLVQNTNTSDTDRRIIEELGREPMEYSDPYFARLTQGASVGENLPTRSCDNCGGPLNPDDLFCSKCGFEII